MGRVTILALAAATALLSKPALAADLPYPMPPMMPQVVQAPVLDTSGWYLRGDIGMSMERFKKLSHPSFATAPQFIFIDSGGFDSAPFFLGAVGYQWNNWLRVDISAEARGKANFHALDRFFNTGMGQFNTNQYTASKSETVVL